MDISEVTRTGWYEGWQKPLYIGPYERIDQWNAILFSHWNGVQWSSNCYTLAAAENIGGTSSYQELRWRGILHKPFCMENDE